MEEKRIEEIREFLLRLGEGLEKMEKREVIKELLRTATALVSGKKILKY